MLTLTCEHVFSCMVLWSTAGGIEYEGASRPINRFLAIVFDSFLHYARVLCTMNWLIHFNLDFPSIVVLICSSDNFNNAHINIDMRTWGIDDGICLEQ